MIVVDLGCATHGVVDSISQLVERFHPETLYGFDPGLVSELEVSNVNGTTLVLERKAAWTYDGYLGYLENGLGSKVYEMEAGTMPCFDFATWLGDLEGEIVVKMDIEGAEYPLCRHLVETQADEKISLALIEWHEEARIAMRCPVEQWD